MFFQTILSFQLVPTPLMHGHAEITGKLINDHDLSV